MTLGKTERLHAAGCSFLIAAVSVIVLGKETKGTVLEEIGAGTSDSIGSVYFAPRAPVMPFSMSSDVNFQ